jgi:hypothetical protein
MESLSVPYRIYWGMILVLATVAAMLALFPQEVSWSVAQEDLPASPPIMALASFGIMLVGYGGLGLVGMRLCTQLGIAGIWEKKVSNRKRFVTPAVLGTVIGIVFIAVDHVSINLHGLGPIPHPPFPSSIGASLVAGIGEEVMFRLFFISFWTWLIYHVVLRGRALNVVFGAVTALSALIFAIAHLPTALLVMGLERVRDMPPVLLIELLVLNGALSVITALKMRTSGILAAVGVHFWADVVWHVLWGAVVTL